MLDPVDHTVPAAADRPRPSIRIRRVQHPRLARRPALTPDHDEFAGPGRPHVDREHLIGILENQHVIARVAAHPVPPHLERAVRLVVDGVEERARVRAPGTPEVAPRHTVDEILAGAQIAEPEFEDLVARSVDAVGEQILVRTDDGDPDVEVAGPGVQRRNV